MSALDVARAMNVLHNGVTVPDYEALLEQGYRRFVRPGDTVVDVGAHAGRHSLCLHALIQPGGRLFAFEPLPVLSARLRTLFLTRGLARTVMARRQIHSLLQKFPPVNEFIRKRQERHLASRHVNLGELALGAQPGDVAFLHVLQDEQQSGFQRRGGVVSGRREKRVSVKVDTLDNQLKFIERLSFIKIDVEGAELDVLRGGEKTLKRFRPIVAVEYGRPTYSLFGHNKAALWEWARAHEYCVSDLFGNVVADGAEWEKVCDLSYWDYFLVPAEKAQWWHGLFL